MKRLLILLILLSMFYNAGLFAQPISRADSVIWYLRQVQGLQSHDSVLLEKAVAAPAYAYCCFLQNRMDSAEYFIHRGYKTFK